MRSRDPSALRLGGGLEVLRACRVLAIVTPRERGPGNDHDNERQSTGGPKYPSHLLAQFARGGPGFWALGVDPAAPFWMTDLPVLQSTWTHPPRILVFPQ
jgi:hypothetical protein